MRARHISSVLEQSARMGFRAGRADPFVALGSYILYAALMMLYAGIVRLIPPADIAPFGLTQEQMIWYLGTCEYIVFAGSEWWYKEIQNDLQSGAIHLSLLRPIPSVIPRLGFWVGEAVARTLILAPAYVLWMLFLTDFHVPALLSFVEMAASLPLAILLLAGGAYFVGATCLWFIQAEPAYWIWQKAIFLLGAMLWPMVFYPPWAQTFLWFTPFPAILAKAGNAVIGETLPAFLWGVGHQIVWAALFVSLLGLYDRKILRHLQETGA